MSAFRMVRWLAARPLLRFAVGGGLAMGLTAAPKAIDPAVELAKLVVTGLRELPSPEAWRYARLPGLEIPTTAGDRETRQLGRDFQLFDDAISVVGPALKAHRPVPMAPVPFLRAAELNAGSGDPAAARARVEFGLKLARTPEARQAFADSRATLPPLPAQ